MTRQTSSNTESIKSTMTVNQAVKNLREVYKNVKDKVKGQDEELGLLFTAMLLQQHVIMTGTSGIGKTYSTQQIAKFGSLEDKEYPLNNKMKVMQGNPDIMATDFVKMTYLTEDKKSGSVDKIAIRPGDLITSNIFFLDEYNRCTPRSLAILLEALNDGKYTDLETGKSKDLGTLMKVVNEQEKLENILNETIEKITDKTKEREKIKKEIKKIINEAIKGTLEKITKPIAGKDLSKMKEKMNKVKTDLDEIIKGKKAEAKIEEIKKSLKEGMNKANDGNWKNIEKQLKDIVKRITYKQKNELKKIERRLNKVDTKNNSGQRTNWNWWEKIDKIIKEKEIIEKAKDDLEKIIIDEREKTIRIPIIGKDGKPLHYFWAIMASNPTSQGGNFEAPEAVKDRAGLVLQMLPPDSGARGEILGGLQKKLASDRSGGSDTSVLTNNTDLFESIIILADKVKKETGKFLKENKHKQMFERYNEFFLTIRQFIFEKIFTNSNIKEIYKEGNSNTYCILKEMAQAWANDLATKIEEEIAEDDKNI